MSEKIAQEKIEKWVEKYPDGYLKGSFAQIAKEIGVSSTSVGNHLERIIAKRDGVLPSEVTARREKAGFRKSPQKRSPEDVAEMLRLHYEEGKKTKDIAYILGCSDKTARKYIKEYEDEILRLHYEEDDSIADIAQVLNCREETVRKCIKQYEDEKD